MEKRDTIKARLALVLLFVSVVVYSYLKSTPQSMVAYGVLIAGLLTSAILFWFSPQRVQFLTYVHEVIIEGHWFVLADQSIITRFRVLIALELKQRVL